MTDLLRKVFPHDTTTRPSPICSPYAGDLPLEPISARPSPSSRFIHDRLAHPSLPEAEGAAIMDDPAPNHPRRRSSSLAGAMSNNSISGPARTTKKNWRASPGEIVEADEDKQLAPGDDGEDSADKSGSDDYEMGNIDNDSGYEDDEETGLTGRQRQKRQKRRRRNTRLDERVAGSVMITKEEEKLANQTVLRSSLINVALIGLWYLFSIAISLYNKWMFRDDNDGGERRNVFPFPLFTTSFHQIVQFSLASLVLFFFPRFRPQPDSLDPHHGPANPQPRQEPSDQTKPLITKWFYFSRIGPCGVATGLDIGLGNMSLRFISLTFFTMCKSSALGFVLIFAFLFRLEQPSWRLVAIIATMTIGVVMMVAGETAFNALGFILVMFSSCSSGFRWSLTQILLLRHPATSNPFSTIMFLAPVIFSALFLIAMPIEGFNHLIIGFHDLAEARGTLMAILILLFPGVLAFLMMTSEFALLKRTSVVTLSICGIFKEVAMVIAASVVFDDKLSPINVSGLIVTICSIGAYNYIKLRKMQEEARQQVHLANETYSPILATDSDDDRNDTSESTARAKTRRISISVASSSQQAALDSSARTSPVKRPEDLD